MSFVKSLKKMLGMTDINEELEKMKAVDGAVLVDVREEDEYAHDRIPGSINIPLSRIGDAAAVIPDRSKPVYIYCLYGTRSSRAAAQLASMGYTSIKNIGGINAYKGPLEGGK